MGSHLTEHQRPHPTEQPCQCHPCGKHFCRNLLLFMRVSPVPQVLKKQSRLHVCVHEDIYFFSAPTINTSPCFAHVSLLEQYFAFPAPFKDISPHGEA